MRQMLAAIVLSALPFQDAPPREGFTVESNEWWHFNYKNWTAGHPVQRIGPETRR
jgi:D-alanyl-D-alanine dipeptidase